MSKWIQIINEKILKNLIFKFFNNGIDIYYTKENVSFYCEATEFKLSKKADNNEFVFLFRTKDTEVSLVIQEKDYIVKADCEKISIQCCDYLEIIFWDVEELEFKNICNEVNMFEIENIDKYDKQNWEYSFINALDIYNDYFYESYEHKVGISHIEHSSYFQIILNLFSVSRRQKGVEKGVVEIVEPTLNIRATNLSFKKCTYSEYIDLETPDKRCFLFVYEPYEKFLDLIVNYLSYKDNILLTLRLSKEFMVHFSNVNLKLYDELLNFQEIIEEDNRKAREEERQYYSSISGIEKESLNNWYEK